MAGAARKYEKVLEAGRWFGRLPEDFRRGLIDAAVVKRLEEGERLMRRGGPLSGLYAVVEGSIHAAATIAGPSSTREVLTAIFEPPVWFGEISVLDGQPRTHDAVAGEPTVVINVPQPAVEALLAADPRRWRDLGVLVATKLRFVLAIVEDAKEPNGIRLARRLLMSAERYGEWVDRSARVVQLRQDQLALMLSTSRQTVNQILKELVGKGLIAVAYGRVEILDVDGLRRYAAGG